MKQMLISHRGLRFLLTLVLLLSFAFGQQAKNYMVMTESLVGMFRTGQLR